MKRLALTVIAVCMLLFCGCGGDADVTPVISAVQSPPDRLHCNFTFNIRFGEELSTLLFSMGSFDADYAQNMLSAQLTRTVLASAAAVTLEYDGKICVTTIEGEEHTYEMTPEEVFGGMVYARPLFPDGKYSATLSSDGLYTVKCKAPDSAKLFALLGDDIYSIAYIKAPLRDKMYCSDAVFTYRLKDGIITDYSLSFTAHLFDTPPYVPGVKVDESDYELELDVEFTASYQQ